ncbi:MAG: hypothetical protein JST89_10945 [Cyanobacteria bacterium SZAS-4]|nr:hypothetical protein [Cyanobacteria bacterium SZAS-4]
MLEPLKTTKHLVTGTVALSLFFICSSTSGKAADTNTSAADKVLHKAESLLETVKDVHYEHLHSPAKEQIDGNVAHNDCSGFVSYLLDKFAPTQYLSISSAQPEKDYPQAKTYAKFFSELKSDQSGWLKVENFQDLKRGDFLAWAKQVQPGQKPGNSGHVAIVAAPPGEVEEATVNEKQIRFVSIKVIDSSSVDHFAPDTLPPNAGQKHRDGLGEGFVRIIVDADNHPIGYWEGTYWNEGDKPIKGPSYTPTIGFARLISLPN